MKCAHHTRLFSKKIKCCSTVIIFFDQNLIPTSRMHHVPGIFPVHVTFDPEIRTESNPCYQYIWHIFFTFSSALSYFFLIIVLFDLFSKHLIAVFVRRYPNLFLNTREKCARFRLAHMHSIASSNSSIFDGFSKNASHQAVSLPWHIQNRDTR